MPSSLLTLPEGSTGVSLVAISEPAMIVIASISFTLIAGFMYFFIVLFSYLFCYLLHDFLSVHDIDALLSGVAHAYTRQGVDGTRLLLTLHGADGCGILEVNVENL